MKGAAGEALGTALEGVFAVGAAIAISLDASWRLGLVVLAVFPLLALAAVFEFRSSAGIAGGSGDALEASLEVASEAATAIRTVAAFNLQWRTLDRFGALLKATVSAAIRQGSVSGGGRGISQFVSLASYSLAFWAGAIFIQRGEMPREALLKVFLAGASHREHFVTSTNSNRIPTSTPHLAQQVLAPKPLVALRISRPTRAAPGLLPATSSRSSTLFRL